MLIAIHNRSLLLARNFDRNNFFRKETVLNRACSALLAAQCEGILRGALNAAIASHVFPGLGHRVSAVHLADARVHEPPPESGVVDLRSALKRTLRLSHHEWRARHGLHTACDNQVRFATGN